MRILSGIAGMLIVLVSAVFTCGMSLAAAFGVFAGSRLARRKGGALPPARSWFSAPAVATMHWSHAICGHAEPAAASP